MFNWHSIEKKKLGLLYLFLSAENRITDADFSLFEELGESVKGFSEMKGDIIGDCEKLLVSSDSKPRFEIVAEAFSSYKTSGGAANVQDRSILWALVSLENKLTTKSDKKQLLIESWAETMNIDKSLVLEMRDTCETQNTIAEYQKWLETSKNMSYREVSSIMQELDINMKSLQQSVSDLIALG